MKKNLTNAVKRTMFVLMLMVTLSSLTVNAQNKLASVTGSKYAKENLVASINSVNEGVRKSAIYLVGNYKLTEFSDVLVERLKNEENASIRLLIAYAIFEIKNVKAMEAVKELAKTDKDLKVRNISNMIYKEYQTKVKDTASL